MDTRSYTTTPISRAGTKADRVLRVSVLFCINASGSSLVLADTMDALKPLVIAKHLTNEIEQDVARRMIMTTTESGWMTRDVFMDWLRSFDDQLLRPTLLLDSAPAHNNVDLR
ncbi:hypothetical protein BGX23_005218, partial [Mortierella sp. AD031]